MEIGKIVRVILWYHPNRITHSFICTGCPCDKYYSTSWTGIWNGGTPNYKVVSTTAAQFSERRGIFLGLWHRNWRSCNCITEGTMSKIFPQTFLTHIPIPRGALHDRYGKKLLRWLEILLKKIASEWIYVTTEFSWFCPPFYHFQPSDDPGRKDIVFRFPWDSLVVLFSIIFCAPPPSKEPLCSLFRRLKFIGKWNSLPDKFCMKVKTQDYLRRLFVRP